MKEKKRSLTIIASDYFTYIGRHLPQQCTNDEFYYLPLHIISGGEGDRGS